MISFFYDTDSELNLELAQKYGIENNAIRFPYTMDGKVYYADLGQNFDKTWFYQMIEKGHVPTTSALNSQEFKEYFEPEFAKGNEVFYVSFGTKFSATFEMMDQAIEDLKKNYPNLKFTRYDTKAISMGTGLLLLKAAECLNEGKTVKETVEILDEFTPYIQISIIVDDLSFLKRGGRLTAGKAFMGGILQLKPLIRLTSKGTLEPFQSIPGRNKAIKLLSQDVIENAANDASFPITILNAECPNDAATLTKAISEARPELKIVNMEVGPVIGSHCGPRAIGICFLGNNPRPDSKNVE